MNVLLINGSPHSQGNTYLALQEIAKTLEKEGISSEIISIGTRAIQGCIACNKCHDGLGHCVFADDLYNRITAKIEKADGLIVGSPTYYAGPNGSLCALLDRVFYTHSQFLAYKPGAAITVCRRGGASACLDRLNKYFTITNMPLVSSQYWNMAHGLTPGEVLQDAEGMQTMRTLARNMSWLLKTTNLDRSQIPVAEPRERTNFIR